MLVTIFPSKPRNKVTNTWVKFVATGFRREKSKTNIDVVHIFNQILLLFQERMEALLPEEALEDDFKSFDMAVRVLTLKDYDYLDFRNEAFDKVKNSNQLIKVILFVDFFY